MQDIKDYFCSHPECRNFGLRGAGNIVKAGTYTLKASGEKKQMLKCTICGMRFSETRNSLFAGCHYDGQTIQRIIVSVASGNGVRATARNLGLSKDRVNIVILRALTFADMTLSSLLRSLHLKEDQLDELWLFIRKIDRQKRQKISTIL
jgi:transposase-like protein